MRARRPRRKRRPSPGERVHGDTPVERGSAWEAVYALVKRIPRGRVMTYGQVATALASRMSARAVGWALHGCPEDVPWQRVVNASGGFSTDRLPDFPLGLQQAMLAAEKVPFRPNGTVDLDRCRWVPPGAGPGRLRPGARHR